MTGENEFNISGLPFQIVGAKNHITEIPKSERAEIETTTHTITYENPNALSLDETEHNELWAELVRATGVEVLDKMTELNDKMKKSLEEKGLKNVSCQLTKCEDGEYRFDISSSNEIEFIPATGNYNIKGSTLTFKPDQP